MPADVTLGIEADEFAQLMRPLEPVGARLAVAVSGGADSMALAFCLQRWSHGACVAFIVDHALRDGSSAEANLVRARCEEIGMRAKILRWDHAPITSRLHEKARDARYALLADACLEANIKDLFVAHHAHDQAETILLRIVKGSGIEGLCGMTPVTRKGHIRILRPFLPVGKERLVATCAAHEIATISDPSNVSEKFARGRLRAIMPHLAAEGLTPDTMRLLARRASEAHEAIAFYADSFLKEHATFERGGSIRINRALLSRLPRAVGLRALASVLRAIHVSVYPPEYAALAALWQSCLVPDYQTTRTLYGCLVSFTSQKVTVMREPAAANSVAFITRGTTTIWDERWIVTARADAVDRKTYTLRALGHTDHARLDHLAPGLRALVPQGRVRATLPGVWLEATLHAIPRFDASSTFQLVCRKQAFP